MPSQGRSWTGIIKYKTSSHCVRWPGCIKTALIPGQVCQRKTRVLHFTLLPKSIIIGWSSLVYNLTDDPKYLIQPSKRLRVQYIKRSDLGLQPSFRCILSHPHLLLFLWNVCQLSIDSHRNDFRRVQREPRPSHYHFTRWTAPICDILLTF